MAISLPSHEIYAVDVPEIIDFSAEFRYNFFVKDESVNDSGGVPESILLKPSAEVNTDYIQFASTRAPRFVVFNFTYPTIAATGNQISDQDLRNNALSSNSQTSLIQDNFKKIVSEDHFSSNLFTAVNFHDSEIEDKVHFLVSGSIEEATLGNEKDPNISPSRGGCNLRQHLPNHISNLFLTRGANNKERTLGTKFYNTSSEVSNSKRSFTLSTSKWRNSRGRQTKRSSRNYGGTSIIQQNNKFFSRITHININAQINSKVMNDIVNRAIEDPNSQHADDMHQLARTSKRLQHHIKNRSSSQISENDYKTNVPYIDVCVQKTSSQTNKQPSSLIGYVIDKVEITDLGEIIEHKPIIIENPKTSSTADFKVKYNSRYKYSIRTIAKFVLPAVDDEFGDLATITILVSSKPSAPIYVSCVETVAPPPPADFNFTWDYEHNHLMVHWAFPPNSQRDIKKFQVFRRKNINEPFELMKLYDFDDSLIRYPDNELPHAKLVEYVKNPSLFFIDDEFTMTSKYIYAVSSVDAHGQSSNYSAQFEVAFDQFKNMLTKRLISHSGAPKPYPNLYLEADTFIDTIKVSGQSSKKMRLYFNPEFYGLTDDDEQFIQTMTTKQQGGCYKIQVVNLDNQKSETINVTIDDITKSGTSQVKNSYLKFGKSKKSNRTKS